MCTTGRAGGVRSKTMEAGYILCELDLCEERFDRVLAVVPARLVPKWKRRCEIVLRNRPMELRNPGMIALTAELLTRNFKTMSSKENESRSKSPPERIAAWAQVPRRFGWSREYPCSCAQSVNGIFGEIDGLQIEFARLAGLDPHLRKLLRDVHWQFLLRRLPASGAQNSAKLPFPATKATKQKSFPAISFRP